MKSLSKQDTKRILDSPKKAVIRIKDIAIIGMMSAVLLVVQVALRFLPNVELVSALIILCTLIFGRKTLYIIYVFVAVEGVIYGFGLWWINYLYVWVILYLIVRLLRSFSSPFLWATVSGIFGLSFGALCSIPYFITGGFATGVAYWINGILFDIIHGIFNFGIALAVFVPFYHVMKNLSDEHNR